MKYKERRPNYYEVKDFRELARTDCVADHLENLGQTYKSCHLKRFHDDENTLSHHTIIFLR